MSNDICKPTGAGAPMVIVGEGQADYLPTMDGVVAQVEAGPQGGHHIWIAVRMKGLLQSGSITAVTGHFPELDQDIGPFQVIFTFDQDEGGYCKLYGLRFQLDQTRPVDQVLGKTLDVQVKVTDKEGAVGIGKRSVVLSKQFILTRAARSVNQPPVARSSSASVSRTRSDAARCSSGEACPSSSSASARCHANSSVSTRSTSFWRCSAR